MTGFSLIELMIVVAILAAIAFPSYQESVAKSKRSDAQGALYGLASALERVYTENNTYCDNGGAGGANNCGVAGTNDTGTPNPVLYAQAVPVDGNEPYYNLDLTVVTTNTYIISAIRTGSMATDKCGDFTLRSTNIQGITNLDGSGDITGQNTNDSGQSVQGNCWR
ncbi:MAG: prepilin-type N-terminal cleavage/methylation domain-containing protein [gamma proteobacterium symbiont of Bathyaustriella thionipta]|nr:prepilin-type N-terminal cleavage/methylation domain-containing protein [gamma proteobacterium symbiont of Bathyaustriella thionipta]MCU7949514.1 prepilin-type N-terminal cleavage/methylation domain-containing protein [gamma proteobacterium symbiont of Bathyaustriella thionipta]MCU7954149.1 prepilin-type N-terminal cleavage/methylation domain-containing protein [gamma proteobacterium symbiont of Bathyaustriella thionipta]MCU7956100.1 prepilin-type N-terminal cleavage/methylation domain-contai